MSEDVIRTIYSHVSRITLNRPERGNVVNMDNMSLLQKYLHEAAEDDDIRAVVIQGRDGVFCRGMDFAFMLERRGKDSIDIEFSRPYIDAVLSIRNCPKPVIAAVDGDVLAGGMGIALASDAVLATRRSRFGLSEVLFGLIPAYVFPFLLERVSLKRARFMVLSSQTFSAEEGAGFGIVDDLADDGGLEKLLTGYLKRFLAASPKALRLVKSYSDSIAGLDLEQAVGFAGCRLTELLNDRDTAAAIGEFMAGGMMEWAVRYKKPRPPE